MAFPRKLLSVTTTDFAFLALADGGELSALPVDAGTIIAGEGSTFVLRPADPLGARANVYLDSVSLITAMNLVQGPKFVEVDTTFAAAHIVPAGDPYNFDQCVFSGEGTNTVLHFDQGSTVNYAWLVLDGISFENDSTVSPAVVIPNSLLVVRDGSSITSTTAAAWGSGATSEASCFVVVDNTSSLGDGTHPVLGGNITWQTTVAGSSTIAANALANSANVSKSGDSTLAFPQGNGLTFVDATNDVIVFSTGGTAGPNVYTTWPGASSALATIKGSRTLVIDDSNGAAHMTAGGPYDLNDTTIVGHANTTTVVPTLIIDQGATFNSLSLQVDSCNITCAATSTIPWVTQGFTVFRTRGTVGAITAGSTPLMHVNAAGSFSDIVQGMPTFGDGTHAVVTVDSGQAVVFEVADFGGCSANAFGGLGQLRANVMPGGTMNTTQGISSIVLSGPAANEVTSTTVTGGGTAAVTVGPTASIAQKRGGKALVFVTASVAVQNTGTVTAALNGSVSGTIANGNASAAAGEAVLLCLSGPDTLTLAGQTYSLAIGGTGGNLTVVGAPVIFAFEYA